MTKRTLRQHRTLAGLTQKQLSIRAKVSVFTLQRYEADSEKFQGASYRTLKQLAGVLGINVWDFDFQDDHEEDNEEFDPAT